MHILLTDIATCPRCGPAFGLILRADEMAERRVREGALGCPNCRQRYPIRAGVADLRDPPDAAQPPLAPSAHVSDEEVYRAAALLGVTSGPGTLLFVGQPLDLAAGVARLVPGIEAAALHPGASATAPAEVSVLLAGAAVPLRTGALLGVLAAADSLAPRLPELVRVLARGARLAIPDATPGTGPLLREHGLRLLLDQDGVVVASAGGDG